MLPKGYYPEDVEEEVALPARPRATSPLWRRALPIVVAIGALAGFSGLLLATYFSSEDGIGGPPPLIRADARPFKMRPDNPGGLEVPHQDVGILNEGRPGQPQARPGERAPQPVVERLLPPPESPLPRPATAPPVLRPEIPPPPIVIAPPDAVEVPQARRAGPPTLAPQPQAPAVQAPSPAQAQTPAAASPNTNAIVLKPPPGVRGVPQQVALAPPAASAPAALTPPVASGFRIQLGVMRTTAEAEREWKRIANGNGDLIARLSPTFVPQNGRVRIQAGPLLTEDGAAQLCRRLAGRGLGCFVVKP